MLPLFSVQWQSITITLVEKVQIIAVFLGSLFLVASISWLLWSALSPQAVWQRRDVLFQICYGMYGFMDLVCVGEAVIHRVFPFGINYTRNILLFGLIYLLLQLIGRIYNATLHGDISRGYSSV